MATKTINDIVNKLDEILDWLAISPMTNKDYRTIHKIFDKYLEKKQRRKK